MYVVLDSNIWLSELGLNTSMGAATRFFLKQRRAKLALPEVIRTEVEINLKRLLSGLTSDIEKNHRQLLAVFGTLKEVVLPTEDQIRDRAARIFEDVKIEIIAVPFTLESARVFGKSIRQGPAKRNK